MHWLDLIMYFITVVILYFILSGFKTKDGGDFYSEMLNGFFSGILYTFIMLIYTIIYIVIFGVFNNNWIDIIHWISKFNIVEACKGVNFNL